MVAKPKKILKPLASNSLVRKKALVIAAMRADGYDDDAIAEQLNIQKNAIHTYLWRAARSGLLVNQSGESKLADPKDVLEFAIGHKVVRNMNAALDAKPVVTDDGEIVELTKGMLDTSMRIAEGTLFKRFDQPKEVTMPSLNVLAVKIEMPDTGRMAVKEGSIGGTPNYVEGEVSDEMGS